EGFKTCPWGCGYDWVITIIVVIVFFLLLANVVSRAEEVDPEKHQPGMTYVPDIKMPGLYETKEKPKKRGKLYQSYRSKSKSQQPNVKHYPPPEVVLTTVLRLIRDVVFGY
ncbi:MAG TPA: hypothetical protein VEP90_29815, partial [Methylomirabilota bacterium]|nr:hypothetical protein [Methylomirabilota bacterium]